MPATYDTIATTTLGSAASTITFSNISQSYTDLRLTLVTTTSVGGIVRVRLNNDSSQVYSNTWLEGNGSTASSSRNTNQSIITAVESTNTTTPTFLTFDLFSYTSSSNKSMFVIQNRDLNGSGGIYHVLGLVRITSAITTFNLLLNTGNFNSGTVATLYGILRA